MRELAKTGSFECGKQGHLARDCFTKRNRTSSRNYSKNNGTSAQRQRPTGTPPRDWRRSTGRKNDRQAGNATGDGSEKRSFHITANAKAVDYHVVKVVTQQGAPTIQVTMSNGHKSLIVDTGSNVSLIKPGVSNNKVEVVSIVPFAVTGHELEVQGVQKIEFYCNNQKYWHRFYVCSLPTDADGIIGMDFLAMVNAKLDLKTQELIMSKQPSFDHGPSKWEAREANGKANRVALTIFSNSDGHGSRQRPKPEVQVGDSAPRTEVRQ